MAGRTADESYTKRLQREEGRWWKRLVDVQAPYRWNLRRLDVVTRRVVIAGDG
jgi:hypothetical protein